MCKLIKSVKTLVGAGVLVIMHATAAGASGTKAQQQTAEAASNSLSQLTQVAESPEEAGEQLIVDILEANAESASAGENSGVVECVEVLAKTDAGAWRCVACCER